MNYLILTNNCTLLVVKYDISGSTYCTKEKKSYFKAESLINYFLFMKKLNF